MEFDDGLPQDGVEDRIDTSDADAAGAAPDWDVLLPRDDQRQDDGRVLDDEGGAGFGELAEATRFEGPEDREDIESAPDPYIDIVSAWRATQEADAALYGRESDEVAASDERLAGAEWTLLQNMVPEIDEDGELAGLEEQLAVHDIDEQETEDCVEDEIQETDDQGDELSNGDTALLDPEDEDGPNLNTSPELADHLVKLVSDHERSNRGLSRNATKRLNETPEVPQEEIGGLLDVLLHTSVPTEDAPSGWGELQVGFGEQEALSMHIFTYPQEIERVTPQATERINIPRQQSKLGGIVDAALGRPAEHIEAEVESPEEAYFVTSNLLCHQDSVKTGVVSAMADPNGIRNPGPHDYDEGMLRSVGVRNYVNSDSQYQYVVRAEVGIDHSDAEIHTRYVVYETARNGGGYVIARSDNSFSERRGGLRATTYIPAAEEVRQLRDLIWVMLNSSSV